MKRDIGWCAVVVLVGLGGRAGAQTVDAPPEASPGAPGYAPYEAPPPPPEPPAAVPAQTAATPPAPVAAPTVGEVGHWAISLERAFGFDYVRETQLLNGVNQQTNSATTFSLLTDPVTDDTTAFSFPRLGFDAFVAPRFSVGASLGVFVASQTFSSSGLGTTTQSYKGAFVAPRVGYVARLTPAVALWARAGLSIIYIGRDDSSDGAATGSYSLSLLAATVEAPFVFVLAPRLAFTFGPTFDYVFWGPNKSNPVGASTATTLDDRVLEIGAQAGLVVTL